MTLLSQIALEFAARGFPVLPCSPSTKAPLLKNGFKQASTDADTVSGWWRRWPNALIGVHPGPGGACVIDLDPKADEEPADVLRRLEDALGAPLPPSPRVTTQSGGWHLWFDRPPIDEVPNKRPVAGVDTRCDNGYVIVPPSVMASGATYSWDVAPEFDADTPLPPVPQSYLDLILKPDDEAAPDDGVARAAPIGAGDDPGEIQARKYARAALDRAAQTVATQSKGGRGETLNAQAFAMGKYIAAGGLTEREVWAALSDAADVCGLTWTDGAKERDAKIRRGIDAGKRESGDAQANLDQIRAQARQRAASRRGPGANADPPPDEPPPHQSSRGGAPPPAPPGGGSGSGSDDGGGEPEIDWKLVRACAEEPQTDIGNARRFLKRFGTEAIWIMQIGAHVYDGRRWAEDPKLGQNDMGGAKIRALAHKTAELIGLEATVIDATEKEQGIIQEAEAALVELKSFAGRNDLKADEKARVSQLNAALAEGKLAHKAVADRRSARRKYANSSGNSAKLSNMVREAMPYVSHEIDSFDADPLAINVLNGTLRFVRENDIWSVRLDAHARTDHMTKLMPVKYDPEAECPTFLSFLEQVQPDEETVDREDLRAFLQRFQGYGLTGLTREQVFMFHYGLGRNGKSTFIDLICRIQGDYAATVPFETLAGDDRRKGSEATPDLARLPAARLVRASEPEERMQFRESMIKGLTSEEPILVRRLHQDFVEIYPAFKLAISGNHKPTIVGTDDGIWRRVLLFPWDVQIAKDKADKQLPQKLWAERSGVLNWLIAGALSYLEDGLRVPQVIHDATQEYRDENDPIGAFIAEACIITGKDEDELSPGSLYAAFQRYCKQSGVYELKQPTFNRKLVPKAAKYGFRKGKRSVSLYFGIKIKPEYQYETQT